MKKITQIIVTALIIAAAVLSAQYLMSSKEEAKRKPSPPVVPSVEILTLATSDFTISLSSRGSVSAKTEGELVSQVAGQIIAVSPNLREGSHFEAGEVLAEIDPRDYQALVSIAEAELAKTEQLYAEEKARGEQAARDWERLNLNQAANDLTLRKPQLAGTAASVKAAQARLSQARLDLERSKIRAPYAGRIRSQVADLGQFVSRGSPIAQIFSSGTAEVRLPLSAEQYRRLPSGQPAVTLQSNGGNWRGKIVRRAGAIDLNSRQIFVIAEVAANDGSLPIGQFVSATITAETLRNVFVIPRTALYEDSYLWVMQNDRTLSRRQVEPLWKTTDSVVVGAPLIAGEQLVTTNLPFASQGMKVSPSGAEAPPIQGQQALGNAQ